MKKVVFILLIVGAGVPGFSRLGSSEEQNEIGTRDSILVRRERIANDIIDLILRDCTIVDLNTKELVFDEECREDVEDLVDGEEKVAGGSICLPGAGH